MDAHLWLQAVYSKFWMELPVPMKSPAGVLLEGILYVGGGFTGSSRTDPVIFAYDAAIDLWRQLPLCPMKWSTLTQLGGKLVAVGGRVMQGAKLAAYTNKVATWNPTTRNWDFILPCMDVSRMCPVVISHQGHLIAAGGKKGSLDFQAEVLHAKMAKWVCGPILPLPCLTNTSAVVGGKWYLLDLFTGAMQYTNISNYVIVATQGHRGSPGAVRKISDAPSGAVRKISAPSGAVRKSAPVVVRKVSESSLAVRDERSTLWKKMENNPPTVPFRIAAVNSQLMAFSDNADKVSLAACIYQLNVWESVKGRLPCTLGSGLLLQGPRGGAGGRGGAGENSSLYVLGGEVSQQYSNHAYKLDLMSCKSLRAVKKSRQARISE